MEQNDKVMQFIEMPKGTNVKDLEGMKAQCIVMDNYLPEELVDKMPQAVTSPQVMERFLYDVLQNVVDGFKPIVREVERKDGVVHVQYAFPIVVNREQYAKSPRVQMWEDYAAGKISGEELEHRMTEVFEMPEKERVLLIMPKEI